MNTIFVSSTFRDMDMERDAIQQLVYPRLNALARQHGQSISFCDLRWGIDTSLLESESGSRKVLDVCLDEIDRCQPPMVVILGYRYGWIPSENLVQTTAQRKQLQLDSLRKSVTALEIEYGALANSERVKNTLFYFREFEGVVPETFEQEDDEHTALLNQLKSRIWELTGGKVRTYTVRWEQDHLEGIDDFAQMLTEDLRGLLLPQWEDFYRMTPHQKEMHTHWTFVQEKAAMFRARKALADTLLQEIRNSKQEVILQGNSGLGKSTLLSYLATQLQADHHVIPVICGLTPKSNTAMNVLQIIVFSLEDFLGFDHLSVSDSNENGPQVFSVKQWLDRMNMLCDECTAAQRNVTILVDAADHLLDDSARQKLVFIPDTLSDHVHFVMTALPELPLQGRPYKTLKPIAVDEKRLIITGMLEEKNRELSAPVIQSILDKPAANTPLYLSLLVQRLLIMSKEDFDSIRQLGDGMGAITAYQQKLVAACPDSLSDMSAELLQVAGQQINGPMIEAVARLIGLSRHGLRIQDLAALLPDSFNALDFSHFISYMSDCFLLRSDGRYDFAHKSIREGFRRLSLGKTQLHETLFRYLSSLPDDDEIRIQERGYHCVMIRDTEELRQLIHQLYVTDCTLEQRSLSTALRHFCLENNENFRWLQHLMYPGKDPKTGLSIGKLFSNWFLYDFEEDDRNHKLAGRLYSRNYTLAKKVNSRLHTERSGQLLVSALGDRAAYCARYYSPRCVLTLRRQAVAQAQALARKYNSSQCRRNLAHAYRMLAHAYRNTNKKTAPELALEYYEKSLALYKKLNAEENTPASRLSLATIYENLSNHFNNVIFVPMNAKERAMPLTVQPVQHNVHREYAAELCGMALELKKQLASETPSERNRYSLSCSYNTLAAIHENQPGLQQFEKVVAYYEQEEVILRELYAESRKISHAIALAACLSSLGDTWFSTGKENDLRKAYDYYVEAAKLRGVVFAALPTQKRALAFASAQFLRAKALYALKDENHMEDVLNLLKEVARYIKQYGDNGYENQFQLLPFYLAATERALGIPPPAKRADLTQTKSYTQYFAYAELLEILSFTIKDWVDRIPVSMMSIFHQYALPDYQPHLTRKIPLEDQDLSQETATLITGLAMNVWYSNQEDRDALGDVLEENRRLKWKKRQR